MGMEFRSNRKLDSKEDGYGLGTGNGNNGRGFGFQKVKENRREEKKRERDERRRRIEYQKEDGLTPLKSLQIPNRRFAETQNFISFNRVYYASKATRHYKSSTYKNKKTQTIYQTTLT